MRITLSRVLGACLPTASSLALVRLPRGIPFVSRCSTLALNSNNLHLSPGGSATALCATESSSSSKTETPKPQSSSIHQDEDGNCIFGLKSYWDSMYQGQAVDDRPGDSYSWYCGWNELMPFWNMLVAGDDGVVQNKQDVRVLIAGIGNDPAPVDMYDDGYTQITAFDYSEDGIARAKELFGERMVGSQDDNLNLLVADARDLPIPDGSIDATLDKGTLDAISITGHDIFVDSVKELTRVTASGGIVMCISRVLWPDELMGAFDTPQWEMIHNGELAFAPDGEATIDLGAELYSWRRTGVR